MRFRGFSFAFGALLLLNGCNRPDTDAELSRAEVEKLLEEYHVALVAAYTAGDAGKLALVATEREQARIAGQIAAFEAQGTALRPALERLTVESVSTAGRTSIAVAALEKWDLRTVALGTEQTLGEAPDQENRVEYTLIRDGGRWKVLARILRASSVDS
jgi:hypothetical protein